MPQPLPIDEHLPAITASLRRHRNLVLVAPPGAGKTTRVPPAVVREALLSGEHPNLVMLQPRRVAARASAERIADENGWQLGREVGYHVRFDRKIGPDTRIRVLTEGILTRMLLDDPTLDGIGAVLLDEFHERSLNVDLAVALLREVQQTVRPDLILVIMSATLDAGPAARYLGDCPVVRTKGRTFSVDVSYSNPTADHVDVQVAGAVRQVLDPSRQADAGDVLCFLPGAEEIRRTARALASLAGAADLLVLPLHGSLPPEEQRLALRPPPPGKRKVVLATNIAETSLTIGGVRTVIDSGLARVAGYDPRRGLDRLDVRRISKASAAQRAGRAGRTAPGRCVRLWTAKEQNDLPDFELPEVRRVDLAGTVLTLHAWGKPDARTFDWYEPPDERALAAAERLLFLLGAVDAESNAKLTPLGRRMAQVPAHPRLARLLIDAADAGLSREGATLAALLSEKDVATYAGGGPMRDRVPTTQADSDVPLRVAMLERAERERFHPALRDNGIDPEAARQVARVRDELLRLTPSTRTRGEGRAPGGATEGKTPLPRPLPEYGAREDAFSKLVLAAYPDRVCKRRESDPSAGTMVGGSGVRLAAESAVRRHALFVAVDARADDRSGRNEALVRVASGIEPQWLEELFPASVTRVRELSFDDVRQRVVGRLVTRYLDLVLSDDANQPVDPQQAGAVLGEALAPRAREIVQSDESAARLLARVALLREHLREPPWPSADPADLVREAAAGVRSVDELRARLADAVRAQLPYPLDRLLEQHAPDAIEVPTGNHIKLDYAGPAPVLAVRLQELFGLADTPRVAAGRVPVVLHLLGPNYRPVQVTSDLRSFWANTYPQVRKDLRARYPKHSWPENPMAATPEARGGRRRS